MSCQLHSLQLQLSYDPMLWSEIELTDVDLLPLVNNKHKAVKTIALEALEYLLGAGEFGFFTNVQTYCDVVPCCTQCEDC